jgi:hypothetical protein
MGAAVAEVSRKGCTLAGFLPSVLDDRTMRDAARLIARNHR